MMTDNNLKNCTEIDGTPLLHRYVVQIVEMAINKAVRPDGVWNNNPPLAQVDPSILAILLHHATTNVEPVERVTWTDAWDCKISMTLDGAARDLKEYYDEWPGGLSEIESSINQWRNRALAAEAKLEKQNQPIVNTEDRQNAHDALWTIKTHYVGWQDNVNFEVLSDFIRDVGNKQ